MASTSRVEQALEYTGYSQFSSRNSFSIKNILNLPEESTAKPVQPSSASNEVSHARPAFPLVPRVVRPYAAFNIDGGFPLHSPPRHWLGTVVQQFTPQMFGWRLTRFFPGVTPYLRRKRPLRKRKQRPLFSQQQVQTLEREFAKRRYVTEVRRSELASRLKLTETQVKTWFQNRRTKWRKESRDELETALMDSKRRCKAENAEKADELDSQSTLPSSASSSSAVPQQSSPLFIDLDNFKLTVTNKD